MTNTEYAQGLRAIAAWYEGHPNAPRPPSSIDVYAAGEDPATLLRSLGGAKKEYLTDYVWLSREFGGVHLRFLIPRGAVCVRRVVGTKTIPAAVVPEHIQEIVEWDCKPILSGDGDEG